MINFANEYYQILYIFSSCYFMKTIFYNGNVIATGDNEVVKALIEMKNKNPVRSCHEKRFVKSALPTPKNIPPANKEINIPWNNLALKSKGFRIVLIKYLCASALKTVNIFTFFFLN